MRIRRIPHPVSAAPGHPAGVTLTEVLMTLMIMSIGVSSVVVLFPISVLRSIQSTQLTNSAILKYNVESRLRQQPDLIFDPDGDYTFQSDDQGRDRALAEHYRGGGSRNYIVDPVGFHAMFSDGFDTLARYFGNDGVQQGFDPGGGAPRIALRRYDGGVFTRFLGAEESSITLGALSQDQLDALGFLTRELGMLGDGRTIQLDSFALQLLVYQNVVIGVQLTEDVLPADLSNIPTGATTRPGGLISDPETAEVTLFSVSGKLSQTFPITLIDAANRKIYWSEYDENGNSVDFNGNGVMDIRPLPVEFGNPPQIGRVVLQSDRPNDYSWMLTVRRSSDGQVRGADVVVRFNTGTSVLDERIFPASFTDGLAVAYVDAVTDSSGNIVEPTLKRGGFIFDAENARWYRITNYEGIAGGNAFSGFDYRITLETSIIKGDGSLSGAIFLPGVVDVYPMGSLPLPESL